MDSLRLYKSPLPHLGRLYHMLTYGYLGQTFGALVAKRHLCYNVLCYVEDQEDLVVNQELLRPDYSYPGLPRTFSVSHDLYSYLRCNSVAADNTRRIILDCEVAEYMRVVPQNLFAPYAGLPRSQSELQNASLVPPIFFILRDLSVGLRLDTARSAESYSPLLLYNDWRPMEGKASIKMRIEVRYVCWSIKLCRSPSFLLVVVVWLWTMADTDPATKPQKGAHHAPTTGATRCQRSRSILARELYLISWGYIRLSEPIE